MGKKGKSKLNKNSDKKSKKIDENYEEEDDSYNPNKQKDPISKRI